MGNIFKQPQQPQGSNFQQEFDARGCYPTDGNIARRDAKTTARDAAGALAQIANGGWAHNPHPPCPPSAAPHVVLLPHLRTQPCGYSTSQSWDNGKPY